MSKTFRYLASARLWVGVAGLIVAALIVAALAPAPWSVFALLLPAAALGSLAASAAHAKVAVELTVRTVIRAAEPPPAEDFTHIRRREELTPERHLARVARDTSVTVPVRLRDGDTCRFCRTRVEWLNRKGHKGGTYLHLGEENECATPETLVVACRACNGIRRANPAADRLLPLLPPPAEPYYSAHTREFLAGNGVCLDDVRGLDQSDLEPVVEPDGQVPAVSEFDERPRCWVEVAVHSEGSRGDVHEFPLVSLQRVLDDVQDFIRSACVDLEPSAGVVHEDTHDSPVSVDGDHRIGAPGSVPADPGTHPRSRSWLKVGREAIDPEARLTARQFGILLRASLLAGREIYDLTEAVEVIRAHSRGASS